MIKQVAVALLAAGLAATPVLAQEPSMTTAGQTVVIPNLPGMGNNQEIRIAGQEIANSEITGPELSVTAEVVQWETGRSITVRLPDRTTRVVPVPSNIIFPPDLNPGLPITFFVRQTSDGRFRVTGLTTGATSVPPLQQPPPPAAAPAPPPSTDAAPAPPPMLTPPPSPPKGAAVRGASYLTIRGTVTAYEKGVTVTVTEKSGKVRKIPVAKDAKVPGDLAVGEAVNVRVPLQRPFDGKTTDQISRATPPKTPIPSKFESAESPKN
jgi:hypothetical protein